MIQVQDLVKWYGPTLAVDRLSFSFPSGTVVGFLGPNGAGKSTTLRILTGYLPPSSGTALIDGIDVIENSAEARRRIGYLPESTPLYPEMRVTEYLHYRGQLYDMDRKRRTARITEVCALCGLDRVQHRLIGRLSKGNRQRVGLAQALIHEPPVIVLDEPTAGLDPNQIHHFRQLISDLKGKHTIILSTHILPEVEKAADQVLIIARGRIAAQGTPGELRSAVARDSRIALETKAAPDQVRPVLQGIGITGQIETLDQGDGWTRVLIPRDDAQDRRAEIAQLAGRNNWPVRELGFESATLEQFFVNVTAQQSLESA